MRQDETQTNPHPDSCLLNFARLRLIVPACFLLYVAGCAHQTPDRTPAPQKPPVMEKQVSPGASQAPNVEQPEKPRAVEKKSKEKKSTAASDRIPDKKLEQLEEPSSDTFVPPPPLKPPTFGGAGG